MEIRLHWIVEPSDSYHVQRLKLMITGELWTFCIKGSSIVILQGSFKRFLNIFFSASRLWKYDKKQWQCSYKALILLEGLLTHGPKRVAEDFRQDKDIIWEMGSLKYVDEKGLVILLASSFFLRSCHKMLYFICDS